MAKKKIEGTEEETPKTNKEIRQEKRQAGKEIRQERRQMRAINAGRKEMGGEKLYTKKEIKDVNKPFESKPSTPLSGESEAVGIGGKTVKSATVYNDPNAPSERTYEYQKIGDKLEVKSKPTKEQFTALNDDDDFTKGDAVRKALTNDAINNDKLTFEQKKDAVEGVNVVAKETKKLVQEVDKQVKDEVKSTTTPTTTETIISTTDPNATPVGGSGATAAGIVNKVPPSQIDWTLSEPNAEFSRLSKEQIQEQAKEAKVKAPQLVIEKLGLQDYYPEAGRDIAVGNFSGSYAGSRTIYSGAGGLLPLGLYDARKRAIATEIKKKEAIMDQIKEIPDIAKQFKTEYSQQYMDFLSPWLNAFKDKPEALMSNTDFLKEMAHYKSVAENFLKVDSDLREFEALISPGDKGSDKGGYGAYATPGMLEILHKFKSGFLPGKTTDWLTGKKNISKLTETVQAIPNGYKIIGDQMKTLLANGQVERVIKPKEGKEVDWNKAKEEIDSIAQQVKDGSSDYESYLTVVKKYYDIDTKALAKQFVEGNSLNALTDKEKEEYINSLSLFADAQIPEASMKAEIERANNDNASRYATDVAARTAANRLAFDKEEADFNRKTSQVLKDVENLLSSNKTMETVQHAGAETTGDGNDFYYHVRMDNGTTKRYKGSQIADLKKQGHKFTGSDGKDFNVPSKISVKPYETTYTKSGTRVNGRTKVAAYTTNTDEEGNVTTNPINAVMDMGETQYTNPDGTLNKAKITEKDIINYNFNPNRAAQGTEGGVSGTSTTTYRRNQ